MSREPMVLMHQIDADFWTPEEVQARLAEAADTLRRLRVAGTWPAGHRNNWPEIVQDFWDAYGMESATIGRLASPKPAAIDRMEEALGWLYGVQDTTARGVLWGKACGFATNRMSKVLGISRYYVDQLHRDNTERLAKRLNGCL